nr:ABC transporter G family member 11-like [Ipomoea trifida]
MLFSLVAAAAHRRLERADWVAATGASPASFVEDMKVFNKENLNGHYGCGAFTIGNTLSSLPYLLLVSIIPGMIAYFPVGLKREFGYFAYFASVTFTNMLSFHEYAYQGLFKNEFLGLRLRTEIGGIIAGEEVLRDRGCILRLNQPYLFFSTSPS